MRYQPQETADGSDTLYHFGYGQTYHSRFGAVTETRYVFVQGTGVDLRLSQHRPTRILEVGFGTGLNFFITAQMALAAGTDLHYVALENALLPAPVLDQLNHDQLLDRGRERRRAFLAWREHLPEPLTATYLPWQAGPHCRLDLLLGDASQVVLPPLTYHAIYHDAFSPDANPELWTETMFSRLYAVLAEGGKLATYSVKGTVRRAMQSAGFRVKKRPGPPGKREVLVAERRAGHSTKSAPAG